jgi:hypothetical protein
LEEFFDGIAIGEHLEDLMHRKAGPPDAGLPVTHFGINGNPVIHANPSLFPNFQRACGVVPAILQGHP